MKYASMTPQDFIPAEIFRFFPEIRGDYRLVASFKHIAQDSIDDVIASIKDLLLHAILVPYEGNWLLIPQVEAYYHEKEVDDVAQNDSHFPYSNNLEVKSKKCEIGRGSWYEVKFRYQKSGFIATGGILGNIKSSKSVDAFLGVAVPASTRDINDETDRRALKIELNNLYGKHPNFSDFLLLKS